MGVEVSSMKLADWMHENKLNDLRMAKLINVAPNTVWRIRTGKTKPTTQTLAKIEEVTHGAVVAKSFL